MYDRYKEDVRRRKTVKIKWIFILYKQAQAHKHISSCLYSPKLSVLLHHFYVYQVLFLYSLNRDQIFLAHGIQVKFKNIKTPDTKHFPLISNETKKSNSVLLPEADRQTHTTQST